MTDRAASYARFRDEALSAPPLTDAERAQFNGAIAREYERNEQRKHLRDPQVQMEFEQGKL
jgi:hypothetical protein